MMKRRDAIKKITVFTGGVIFLSTGMMSSCKSPRDRISDEDVLLLDEIGETIIPQTSDCGGARAAKIGLYMKVMFDECLSTQERKVFLDGLVKFEAAAREKFKTDFLDLDSAEKKELFLGLQGEAARYGMNQGKVAGSLHYFDLFKKMTIDGYFTSEIGATKARRYQAVPGQFKGCISYVKGDRAWATS
ncbi:gluconate 2-dehydrogenase subunit 3 family protein [Pedobacter frigiditerrae]|uniref:Gluconate 2-dehydrogenase subunit 3 family protein n=1 Tax=Pedobacter frigiditerrae TaxID=2530452 RepID=A0A4R0MP00_9SPHI|nr:gluconate 2-dehydrogenase subunit 3 family protein [Pedobacter frigiditerrae]TCC88559.1 gluconate 2-dehydrogenase subunit 3 family protein [Pedobacter frigiditerrae]